MTNETSQYHRTRAEEARVMAGNALNQRVRDIHLELASRHDVLAAEATDKPQSGNSPQLPAMERFTSPKA